MADGTKVDVLLRDLDAVEHWSERAESGHFEIEWRFSCAFSLEHARMRAERGDVVGAMGQAAKAAIEKAHEVLAEKRTWVFNEKRILERAGLTGLHALFSQGPRREELVGWVSTVRAALGVG